MEVVEKYSYRSSRDSTSQVIVTTSLPDLRHSDLHCVLVVVGIATLLTSSVSEQRAALKLHS